jgi:predicted transcriptional regulator
MTDTTVTVRLSTELRDRLQAIGAVTRRSKSFLAQEAIATFVEAEEKHILGIQKALEDMKAGKGVPHEDAMAQIRATIRRVGKAAA